MSQNKIYCKDCKYLTEYNAEYPAVLICCCSIPKKNEITGITEYVSSFHQHKIFNKNNNCKYFKESLWFKIKKFFNKFK